MSTSQVKKLVKLRSSDEELFEVELKVVASQSQTIKDLVEDLDCCNFIPLPNVSSKVLAKVLEFFQQQAAVPRNNEPAPSKEDLKQWNAQFLKDLNNDFIFDLLLAASYLNIPKLLDITCQFVADVIKNLSVEEVRSNFNIENDFTPEEEAEVRRENQWVFE